jgi:hypothetical protein
LLSKRSSTSELKPATARKKISTPTNQPMITAPKHQAPPPPLLKRSRQLPKCKRWAACGLGLSSSSSSCSAYVSLSTTLWSHAPLAAPTSRWMARV